MSRSKLLRFIKNNIYGRVDKKLLGHTSRGADRTYVDFADKLDELWDVAKAKMANKGVALPDKVVTNWAFNPASTY